MSEEFGPEEFESALLAVWGGPREDSGFPLWRDVSVESINKWLARGDGAAFYRNEDLGHYQAGHVKVMSFGSPTAQLEGAEAPVQLPDIGGAINWRYQLWGTYRGAAIRTGDGTTTRATNQQNEES